MGALSECGRSQFGTAFAGKAELHWLLINQRLESCNDNDWISRGPILCAGLHGEPRPGVRRNGLFQSARLRVGKLYMAGITSRPIDFCYS